MLTLVLVNSYCRRYYLARLELPETRDLHADRAGILRPLLSDIARVRAFSLCGVEKVNH